MATVASELISIKDISIKDKRRAPICATQVLGEAAAGAMPARVALGRSLCHYAFGYIQLQLVGILHDSSAADRYNNGFNRG